MADQNTIQEKRAYYKKLINTLESTHVPERGLELFTVGDNFRSEVSRLESELHSLSVEPIYKEFIIHAPFGGGKTHFLKYLSSQVVQNDSQSVMSWLDMSRVSSADDFEKKIIQGMRTSDGKGYGDVLRVSYTRIIEQMQSEYLNATPQELNKIFETLLYFILGAMSEGVLSKSVLQLLGELNPVSAFVNLLTKKTVANLASQARLNSSKKTIDFVDSFMGIIQNKEAPLSKFDEACSVLAKEKELCHVVFRMLRLASYKSVVIFVDELETVRKFDETKKAEILTAIRAFRDRFSLVGEIDGYPSTGLIVASTSQFSGAELEKLEPALYDRWKRKRIPLPIFSQADIDHLLFRLRDLFYLAGYRLKPLHTDDIHEIILLRRKIFENSDLTERHPRDVIAELIKMIQDEWVL